MKSLPITDHAVARYREKVKPALSPDACRAELGALIEQADKPVSEPPWPWPGQAAAYLPIAPGVALALEPDGNKLVAVTCIARGTLPDKHRRDETKRKRQRRADKRARKLR